MDTLSLPASRRLFLERQGLLRQNAFGRGQAAVERAVNQLGYVQIDTISVVQRAHDHVLNTRVANYEPRFLDNLQRQRQLFEYWFHAAAYLPMSEYRYYLPVMDYFRQRYPGKAEVENWVLKRITEEGPLQARDFENTSGKKARGWWDWKPAKHALESLYRGGKLMISHRERFQKVFDLPERVIPADISTRPPDATEWHQFVCRCLLGSLGAACLSDLTTMRQPTRTLYQDNIRKGLGKALTELMESGEVTEVRLEGSDLPHYILTEQLNNLPARLAKPRIHFLSPFDNLVINRDRLQRLFNFDYVLECYVPAPKRQYGYFVLPILRGMDVIGRLDAKAFRSKQMLQINMLMFEPGIQPSESLIAELALALVNFVKVNACNQISLTTIKPTGVKQKLNQVISQLMETDS